VQANQGTLPLIQKLQNGEPVRRPGVTLTVQPA
jgi:hypothetical protein